MGIFGWFEKDKKFVPTWKEKNNDNLSVKNQGAFNTCVYNASTVSKEPDEGVVLSVRSLVTMAKRDGLLTGNGWSASNAGFKTMQKHGIMEIGLIPENVSSFESYANASINQANADKHKISSFFEISTRDELLKVIDEGRRPITNLKWYTGFNQGGGFSDPWIISRAIGLPVGWHQFEIFGAKLDFNGMDLIKCQNSYGDDWGFKGCFYVEINYLLKNCMDILVQLDEVDKEVATLVHNYDGKNVKSIDNPAVYHIQNGQKKVYMEPIAYYCWNIEDGKMKNIEVVDGSVLARVPDGDIMDPKKSIYWPFIEHMKEPENVTYLLNLIKK